MNNKTNPAVFIIILNWNGWRDTIECLKSLQHLTYPNFRIIICDNGSTDDSINRIKIWALGDSSIDSSDTNGARSMKPIKLIEYDQADAEKGGTDIMESFIETPPHNGCMVIIKNKDNLGFAAGNNVALRYAIKRNIPFIMLLNNDTVVTPDFLTCLTKDLINNSQWMAIGPKILYHNNPQYIWYAGAQINLSQIAVKHLGYNQIDSNHWTDIKPTDHISACCILARNKLFKLIGLFDEEYFFIHEDWDFSCRVKKNGLKLAVDLNAVVYHKVGGSINNRKGNLKNIYFSNKNRLLLMKKNASTKEMIRGFGYYTLSRFVKFLSLTLHLKISQLFIEIKSIRDFFSGYFGIFDRNNASSVNQHNIKLN